MPRLVAVLLSGAVACAAARRGPLTGGVARVTFNDSAYVALDSTTATMRRRFQNGMIDVPNDIATRLCASLTGGAALAPVSRLTYRVSRTGVGPESTTVSVPGTTCSTPRGASEFDVSLDVFAVRWHVPPAGVSGPVTVALTSQVSAGRLDGQDDGYSWTPADGWTVQYHHRSELDGLPTRPIPLTRSPVRPPP